MSEQPMTEFVIDGIEYEIPAWTLSKAGDVVQLPDGRMYTTETAETWPPQIEQMYEVAEPPTVPPLTSFDQAYTGKAYGAIEIGPAGPGTPDTPHTSL
jgi:hypothetical protein